LGHSSCSESRRKGNQQTPMSLQTMSGCLAIAGTGGYTQLVYRGTRILARETCSKSNRL
jgi:hypothetical protein